ncbi:MAG: hypothetical protein PWP65_357 [Clostridia bacterium]|nr:hypothetical protein [Clostridia bacterium]
MEVYDRAHELARALARCREYRDLSRLRARIKENPEALRMLKDYRERMLEAEMKQLQGEALEPEKQRALEDIERLVRLNPTLSEFLEAQARVARLLADIQKILLQSVPDFTELLS